MFDAQCYDSAWDAVSRDRPKFNQMAKATKAQVRAGSKIANSEFQGPGTSLEGRLLGESNKERVRVIAYDQSLVRSVSRRLRVDPV